MPGRFNSNLMKRRTQSGLEVIPEKDTVNNPILSFDAMDLSADICSKLINIFRAQERGMSSCELLYERYINNAQFFERIIKLKPEARD